MTKRVFIFIMTFFFLKLTYSQDKYKDPFEPLLPQSKKVEEVKTEEIDQEAEKTLPPIVLQGVLWGSDTPQAIIDGEVYKIGDKLQDLDAKLFKIDKNIVFISYGEKIHEIKIKTKGGQ
ncbi:MAG: hypothetical protein ABIE75_01905 [Candidatus Omnitrophota bacterium]